VRTADFDYELPEGLIAQRPGRSRAASRLLALDGHTGALEDACVADIGRFLRPGDLLVLNDTRVIKARLAATKPSGGRVELLVERLLDDRRALAQARSSRPLAAGAVLEVAGAARIRVEGRWHGFYMLALDPPGSGFADLLARAGSVPLPPYIRRPPDELDEARYQTVYARRPGAVAAPTAGLHFDEPLLERLEAQGIEIATITLHIGAGTFQPIRAEHAEAHRMHPEWLEVSAGACERAQATRERGGRVVAVGTTVVRALETAARDGAITPYRGDTRLYIYPGFQFRVVDALVTNFHLPRSTLLMLVCAFAGRERVLAAYRHAVRSGYRFYSFGDAMLATRAPNAGGR